MLFFITLTHGKDGGFYDRISADFEFLQSTLSEHTFLWRIMNPQREFLCLYRGNVLRALQYSWPKDPFWYYLVPSFSIKM